MAGVYTLYTSCVNSALARFRWGIARRSAADRDCHDSFRMHSSADLTVCTHFSMLFVVTNAQEPAASAPVKWGASSVRALRLRMGLSQERFAHEIGVTGATVNRWENGHAHPQRLAEAKLRELAREHASREATR